VNLASYTDSKTIWGNVSWPEASRDAAVDLLPQGYVRVKKAEEMMSHVQQTLLLINTGTLYKNYKRNH
jgi:hypothetical protein